MMKRSHIAIGLLLISGAAHARAPYFPPLVTEQPTPVETPRSIFASFKFGYQVGAEVELSMRSFARVVDDVQTPNMDQMLASARVEYTLDYLNAKSFAVLIEENPELARQLTAGLSTESNIKEQIKAEFERDAAARVAKFREGFHRPGGAVPLVPLIGSQPIIQRRHAPLVGSTQKLDLKPVGLLTADGSPVKDAAIAIPLDSDWPRVNARWNALNLETRKANIHFEQLNPHLKASVYSYVLPNRFGSGRYSDVDFTKYSQGYLQPFYVMLDGMGRRVADGTATSREDEIGAVVEFKHRRPETSATRYLEQLFTLTDKAMISRALREPLAQSLRDSSYHLNFSVSGRPGSIDPVLRAWNHLIVVRLLDAGITNLFGRGFGKFRDDLNARGMVRKRSENYFEVREHFTDPETELSMLMQAFNGTNAEARQIIYGKFMPKLTTPVLRVLYRQHRPLFYDLVLGTPELKVTIEPEVATFVDGVEDAEHVLKKAFANPNILANKERVKALLGEEGTALLKKGMASNVLLAALRGPKLLSYYREMLVEEVGCAGKFAVLCSPAARAVAISNATLGAIDAVKELALAGKNAGFSLKASCQSLLTGARSALGRMVPQ